MLFWKLIGGLAAKIGIGLSLIFSPTSSSEIPSPLPQPETPLILAPETPALPPEPEKKREDESESTPEEVPSASPDPAPKPSSTPSPAPTAPPEPAPSPLPPGSNLNDVTRAALVNILCTTGGGGILKPISGSGAIIDSRGVILTNAHVAQFFLLRDYPIKDNVTCVLRSGSPARALYTAKLLYFPSAWMAANARKIVEERPTGTGENDYAFLVITGRTDPEASLPSSFSYVSPSIREPESGEEVLLAGYPAGFLDGTSIQLNLFISSAKATVGNVFTFKAGGGTDLVSVGGTILSQSGSSGGAVVAAKDAALIGTLVTSTSADTTAGRDLRAITVHHINESYLRETSETIADLLSGDVAKKATIFNLTEAPSLSRSLIEELEK